MKTLKTVYRRMQSKVMFHAEKYGIFSADYPRRIVQKELDAGGIWFEVHNINEANRVRSLDDEDAFLRQLLNELYADDVFFDVGACLGMFSIHAAKRCRHVVAFEPDPGFREHLQVNVRIDQIENLMVLPYAISDRAGVLSLYTDGTNGKSPSLEDNGFESQVKVESRTLSELVSQDEVPSPSVIKMDIEGAEILALRGMQELFTTTPPRLIFLELHPLLVAHFGSSSAEVLLLLEQAGYEVMMQRERDEQAHLILKLVDR